MTARLDRLVARRQDPEVASAGQLNEVYKSVTASESVRYVLGAMQPIDAEYTKNTYAQGERVRNQLQARLSKPCDYRYQGSVTNDTHIKARSDIDLLAITKLFETLEQPQVPQYPYSGNPIQDLQELREDLSRSLSDGFREAKVTAGSKSIKVSGGSLKREIDVVPSNWFNTNDYANSGNDVYRGVHILDSHNQIRLRNTPWLHNQRIQEKDSACQGNMRRAARLMKSLRYDSNGIRLSSYDIVSIAYTIPTNQLVIPKPLHVMILEVCCNYCDYLANNPDVRDRLDVPDGHRKIFGIDEFGTEHATQIGLGELAAALFQLRRDVLQENQRSFQKLAEARVEY